MYVEDHEKLLGTEISQLVLMFSHTEIRGITKMESIFTLHIIRVSFKHKNVAENKYPYV